MYVEADGLHWQVIAMLLLLRLIDGALQYETVSVDGTVPVELWFDKNTCSELQIGYIPRQILRRIILIGNIYYCWIINGFCDSYFDPLSI